MLVQKQGACIYCGQVGMVKVEEQTTVEDVDREVTKQCDCTAAQIFARKLAIKEYGHEKVEELFRSHTEEIRGFLKESVNLMVDGEIKKIKINITAKISASMSMTAKGYIKIEKIMTSKEVEEIL